MNVDNEIRRVEITKAIANLLDDNTSQVIKNWSSLSPEERKHKYETERWSQITGIRNYLGYPSDPAASESLLYSPEGVANLVHDMVDTNATLLKEIAVLKHLYVKNLNSLRNMESHISRGVVGPMTAAGYRDAVDVLRPAEIDYSYPYVEGNLPNKEGSVIPLTNITANPHLDKVVLTPHELSEVLAWAIMISNNGNIVTNIDQARKATVDVPNPIIKALVDMIGEQMYGPNNYIGPLKTGGLDTPASLEEIVTSRPAFSEDDSRARAHDIGLTISSDPAVDTILSPVMHNLQVFRPIFVPDTRVNQRPERYNFNKLKLSGDVEDNPGPKEWNFDNGAAVIQAIKNIASDPSSATNYLDERLNTELVDWMSYTMKWGNVVLRSGIDDRTDRALASTNWMRVNGYSATHINTPQSRPFSIRAFHHQINNSEAKKMSYGRTGEGIEGTLHTFTDYLAAQRTSNNMVNGDTLQTIWSRMPRLDYGFFLPFAKLIIYSTTERLMTGDSTTGWRMDSDTSLTPLNTSTNGIVMYPRSSCVLSGTMAITATWITATEYAQVLRGELDITPFHPEDKYACGTMTYTGRSISRSAWSLIAICHLESPFMDSGNNVAASSETSLRAPPAVPITATGASINFGFTRTLLPGAKQFILFVKTSDDPNDISLDDGTGTITIVTRFTTAPAGVNVGPRLCAYYSRYMTRGRQNPDWQQAFDYFSMTADLNDWTQALMLTASVIQTKFPYLPYGISGGATTTPVLFNDSTVSPAPTVDASVAVTDIHAASQAQLDTTDLFTCFNCFGSTDFVTSYPDLTGALSTIIAPSCMAIQDTPFITYYGIHMGMVAKESIFGTNIAKIPKTSKKRVFYAVLEIGDIMMNCVHHYFQDNGTTYRMLLDTTTPQVSDMKTIIKQGLSDWWCDLTRQLNGGYCPFRMFSTPGEPIDGYPAVLGYWNSSSFLDSPIYLHSDIMDMQGDQGYYPVHFQPQMSIADFGITWDPANLPAITLSNISCMGAGSLVCDKATSFEKGRMKQNVRLWYAITQAMHLLNGGAINRILDVQLYTDGGRGNSVKRPPIQYFKRFLEWTSGTTPSDVYRLGQRPSLALTLPYYPAEVDVVSGSLLLLAMDLQTVATNLRAVFSLDGKGSATAQYTSAPYLALLSAYGPKAVKK